MKMTDAHKRTRNAVIHGRHCRKLVTRLFTSGRFVLYFTAVFTGGPRIMPTTTKHVDTRRHVTAYSKLY